jgi:5'-3' exonuclease
MILIDYNAIAISNVLTQKVELDENLIRHMILNSIRIYRKKYKNEFGEIVITNDGSNNWRREVFPQYKFKRKSSRDDSKIDWDELFRITNLVFDELVEYFPYKVIKHDRCEADDVIATLCEYTQEFGNWEKTLIVSSDKDFIQLQKYDNVYQYSPMNKRMIKEKNPRLQLMELILGGDSSDGVPNVLSNDNVFVEGIRQTPLSKKKKETLIQDQESLGDEIYRNFQRNKLLIDLSSTPEKFKKEIINNYNSQDKSENKKKVMNFLINKKCRLLLEETGDFL